MARLLRLLLLVGVMCVLTYSVYIVVVDIGGGGR